MNQLSLIAPQHPKNDIKKIKDPIAMSKLGREK
jgi:hypothetical protein